MTPSNSLPNDSARRWGARVASYAFDAPEGFEHETVTVVQTGQLHKGVFIPSADVWAIRKGGWCLNRDGQWEFEPQPSSRDNEFYARCRFPREEALQRAQAARNADNLSRRDSR